MGKRHQRNADGKFHISGQIYEDLIGTRAKVWHGSAYKTAGGLIKKDLIMNKNGRIVSKIKQATAKKDQRLARAGYKPKKGQFVVMRKSMKASPGPRIARKKTQRKRSRARR